jgi:hypothetical protein
MEKWPKSCDPLILYLENLVTRLTYGNTRDESVTRVTSFGKTSVILRCLLSIVHIHDVNYDCTYKTGS